jgi:hypothetical protein
MLGSLIVVMALGIALLVAWIAVQAAIALWHESRAVSKAGVALETLLERPVAKLSRADIRAAVGDAPAGSASDSLSILARRLSALDTPTMDKDGAD